MRRLKKRYIRLMIAAGVLLALSLVCFLVSGSYGNILSSQKAAERWAGDSDMSFAQLSAYLGNSSDVTLTDVYGFRTKLIGKLTGDSLAEQAETAPEALFADAWSAAGKLKIEGAHGSADAAVTAVGGDFFLFHPLTLRSGSYIAEDDVMDDRVVLDRELAWRLYGGDELTGLTVTIAGQPFVVAGVVEREQDFASKKARENDAGLFMSYRAYANLIAGDGGEVQAPPIVCYELVMPQPVKGYAEAVLREHFPKLQAGETVNNTDRYSAQSLWKILTEFGTRSMHRSSVIYPDWENAARCTGDWCALFFALGLVFALFPAGTALVLLMLLLVKGRAALSKRVPKAVAQAVDRSRSRRYHGAHEKK